MRAPRWHPELNRENYIRKIGLIAILSVVAWVSFAALYRLGFPRPSEPGDSLRMWWLWLFAGTFGFQIFIMSVIAILKIPSAWRMHAVMAFSAPALICDVWTGTQTEKWLPNAGSTDDRLYLSLIVGGVGIIQALALVGELPRVQYRYNEATQRGETASRDR